MIHVGDTLVDNGFDAFAKRPELEANLAYRTLCALAEEPGRVVVVDRTAERTELDAGRLLTASLALAHRWKKTIPGERVGIVFPPGIGALLANLGVLFAGKTPVNLNFTLSPAANSSCIRRAELETIISAQAMQQKFDSFPWPADVRDLSDERHALGKAGLAAWYAAVKHLPPTLLAKAARIPAEGGDREAGILFSSGSVGEPKGVVLSHRNIIGNCEQINATGILPHDISLLACLPIFHSFGFTVSIWYALINRVRIVTVPSPLEYKKIAQVVEEEKVEVLLGTPTFFRPYLTRIEPGQLESLKFVIAGAEKTPEGFGEQWEARFPGEYLEGYGLTETSPVVGVNMPKMVNPDGSGRRKGAIGKLFPGMQGRIRSLDSYEVVAPTTTGVIEFRGPNIFTGYLGDPEKTQKVLEADGWFATGDLGRFDADGFLYIEGRLSRFSKIGGEMVPHGVVEHHVAQLYGVENSDVPLVAVSGRRDERKGEALVLISAINLESAELREKLMNAGIPNLWVPRHIVRVDSIPTLASGKLDLKQLAAIAERG